MGKRVCPWWLGYLLASPLRRLFDDPARVLDGYVRAGMTVLEPGPGMGFFTLEMARMVGANGRVVAVDIQKKMLDSLKRRAQRAHLADRIDARLAPAESMNITDLALQVDFTLAYAVVHEFPSPEKFFSEVAHASKPGAMMFFAEPAGHVNDTEFAAEIAAAENAGFVVESRPKVKGSHAALLKKTDVAH